MDHKPLILTFFLCSLLSTHTHTSLLPSTARHYMAHTHPIRCENCFCGGGAIRTARHHCPNTRDLVRCPSNIRKCYRCSCVDRTPLTPAPSPRETHADHGDHGDHDDDDGDDHMHGDGDVHVDETPVASVSASVSGTPSVSPSVPPSVSPSVSPSVTASQTPSATATATPSESPYAKCKKIKKRNVSGTSVIHFSTGQDSGKFKITYKPNDGLSRVDVLYTGDATYDTVPEVGGNGVVKVKYRGSSEIGIIVERRVGVRGSVRVVIHCPV